MKIIEYEKQYKDNFIELNVAWLEKYFVIEKLDYDMLYHVEEFLERGAMVYFAVESEQVLSTCMVLPHENDLWEICKLATDEKYQGHGAGSAVLKACMDYAIEHGAKKLTLVTSHILKPALSLYEKFGFECVPLEDKEYDRADVQFDYVVSKQS